MQVTTLGRTGLLVTRLGLGLASIGRPGYINLGHAADVGLEHDVEAMETHAHTVLDAAWKAGVRYFDAARSYGRAEEFLANWLAKRQIVPGTVTVGSKWGYTYTAGWKVEAKKHEIKDHSLENLRRQVGESRGILRAHLDLYQIHSATFESGVLENRPVLEELFHLQESGLKIGLSVSGPYQAEVLKRALDIAFAGERLFDCVQATWNILEPSAGAVLEQAHKEGLGIIIKEALANGRLTTRNVDPAFADYRQQLEDESLRLGTSLDALALATVLDQPWADVVLSGASTSEQLRSNLSALAVMLDAQAREWLTTLAEHPTDYWDLRARMPWN